MADKKGRITGIGGIFFKSKDPEKLKSWYKEKMGIDCNQWGYVFEWGNPDFPESHGYTNWSVFEEKTDYLDPGEKDFMINYRVENLEALLKDYREKGIEIVGDVQVFDYGKFAWIMDPEGQKIELWEPNDEEFGKMT